MTARAKSMEKKSRGGIGHKRANNTSMVICNVSGGKYAMLSKIYKQNETMSYCCRRFYNGIRAVERERRIYVHCFCIKPRSISIGTGKMMVEFFSAEIDVNVCK